MILGATFVEGPASTDADDPRDCALARAVRQSDGHADRPFQRAQPVRRFAAGRREEQVGLRAPVGGRRDLGHRAAARRGTTSISIRRRAPTPGGGSRSPASCTATAGVWIAARVAPPRDRARRGPGRSRRPPRHRGGTAADRDLQRADRRRHGRPGRRPGPDSVLARHERRRASRVTSASATAARIRRPPPRRPSPLSYNDGNRVARNPVQGAAGAVSGRHRSARGRDHRARRPAAEAVDAEVHHGTIGSRFARFAVRVRGSQFAVRSSRRDCTRFTGFERFEDSRIQDPLADPRDQ